MASNKVTIATHNAEFHADDVFAVATLKLSLGSDIEVIRTRDEAKIKAADFAVDVGGIYDVGKNRFDHHQGGGAGKRANGIPYASFGLVWKTFGEKVSGSKIIADMVEKKLVTPIDADDNGVNTYKLLSPDVSPYLARNVFSSFLPVGDEPKEETDKIFLDMVALAEKILGREIKRALEREEGAKAIQSAYNRASDKRVIILDKYHLWHEAVSNYPEALYVILPKSETDWRLYAVRENQSDFKSKKDLPASWAGKSGKELEEATGVKGVRFCHNNLFMAAADSKEAVLKLADLALK